MRTGDDFVDSHIQQEIINIKARLYELHLFQNEETTLREKLAYLIGKNEGTVEMEKLIDKKVKEALELKESKDINPEK